MSDPSCGLALPAVRSAPLPAGWETQRAHSGEITARLDGKWIHSPRDPRREAERLVDRGSVPGGVVVFYGLGLAFAVERHLERSPDGYAIVVEPDVGAIRAAMEARDLSRVVGSPRVQFVTERDPHALAVALRRFEHRPIRTVRLRALIERHAPFFSECDRVQKSFFARREINSNTLKRFGGAWVRNLVRNLPLLEQANGVELLQGRFSGLPALLLAAGPSLDSVLPHLRELRRAALIIAVDTAAAALSARGYEADVLVVVDPQWWNTRHLDRVKADRAVLVSESSTHPRVFRLVSARPLFAESLFPLGRYLERATRVRGVLGAGGSVATSAWDLARMMGCTPIYCAGLDLGFPSGQTHFRGSYFEERMHTLARRLRPAQHHAYSYLVEADPYPVPDNRGRSVLTDQRMAIYRWWFENQHQMHRGVDTRNLSPTGVAIAGMPHASIEELLDMPERRTVIDERLERLSAEANAPPPPEHPARLRTLLADLEEELTTVERLCAQALETLKLHCNGRVTLSDALRRFDESDRNLRALRNRDIAGFLIQDGLARILRGETREDALETSRSLYASLRESALFHIRELRRASSFLNNQPIV